ncbi:hypothetical protein [Nostoc sp.]|uniref:hypothetical protein n=1 Tax=Nostoc sp. TaxID=1180 RepID=UPI002FF5694E
MVVNSVATAPGDDYHFVLNLRHIYSWGLLSMDRETSGAVSDELSIIQPYQLICILDQRFCPGNVTTNPNHYHHTV